MKNLIIVIAIIGLAAVAGSVVVGINSYDGIITENPYEKGLLWDDTRKKKKELGWSIGLMSSDFKTGDNELMISVMDKYGKPLKNSAVSVVTGRSETSEYDHYSKTVLLQEGLFGAHIEFPVYGYWNITIKVAKDNETLSFKKRVFVKKDESAGIQTNGSIIQ